VSSFGFGTPREMDDTVAGIAGDAADPTAATAVTSPTAASAAGAGPGRTLLVEDPRR